MLFVDDEPDLQRGFADSLPVPAQVLDPDEVTVSDALDADLVLCDFVLDGWARDADEPAIPGDGVALAASIRSHLGTPGSLETPTAFALYSGHVDDLAGALPKETRLHTLSRALNLEWVFPKVADVQGSLANQIVELAVAVHDLPEAWKLEAGHNEALVRSLLRVDGGTAAEERAWADVLACRPPLHELSTRSHGLAFLRWLLHRILPHSTFLWDDARLALRLRVMPDDLTAAVNSNEQAFEAFRYTGPLGSFAGRRWWRSLVESFLWQQTDGRPFDHEAVTERVAASLGRALTPIGLAEPVLPLDGNYRAARVPIEAADAVRIVPDDWPTYADVAWVHREVALQDARLLAVVVEDDRSTLPRARTP